MNTDTAVQAHLDGDSTTATAAELSAMFSADAGAARAAVSAALLHAQLARRLGPAGTVAVMESLRRPEPLWRRRPRLVTGAAAAVAVLVTSMLWPRGETVIEAPRVPPGAPSVKHVETPGLSEAELVKATEPRDFLTEMKDKLDRYYVRPKSFEQVRTVRGLIAQLQTEVRAVNHQREPFYDAVTFDVPANMEDRELPERFTAAFCGGSAWTVVEAVGALMDWEARADRLCELSFSAVQPVQNKEVVTHEFGVFPGWRGFSREDGASSDDDGGNEDARAALAAIGAGGLQQPQFHAPNSLLLATGTAGAVAKAERLLALTGLARSPAVGIQAKFLQLPEGLNEPTVVVGDDAMQAWMRRMSQLKGVDLLSAPTVAALSAQAAMIEVKQDAEGGGWSGIQAQLVGELQGRCIQLTAAVEVRPESGPALISDVEGLIPSGQTGIFRLSERPGDPNIVVAITATMIDPSGVPK